jgi:DNA primase
VVREVLNDFKITGLAQDLGFARDAHQRAHRDTLDLRRSTPRRAGAAREVERRAPKLATSKWWKEERHGVFVDYNQNAKDRTVAAAYSVRPKPDARVRRR